MESGSPVTWLEEENYLFRLTAFIPQLIDWLEDDPSGMHYWRSLLEQLLII